MSNYVNFPKNNAMIHSKKRKDGRSFIWKRQARKSITSTMREH